MRQAKTLIAGGCFTALLLLSACNGDGAAGDGPLGAQPATTSTPPSSSAPDPTSTSVPPRSPAPDPTTPRPRTGVAFVDEVIDELLDGDAEALAGRAVYQRVPCSTAPAEPATKRCPAGVEDGDEVEVFTFVGCHGEPTFAPALIERIASTLATEDESGAGSIYAVVRGPAGQTVAPWHDYVIVVESDGRGWAIWLDDAGGLTLIDRGCGVQAPSDFIRSGDEFLLPPGEPG